MCVLMGNIKTKLYFVDKTVIISEMSIRSPQIVEMYYIIENIETNNIESYDILPKASNG